MARRSKPEAVVAGHICLDITPRVRPGQWASLGELLRPGTLVSVGAAALSTGGAVSNTGLALEKLGVRTALMGKCGEDAFGRVVLDLLRTRAPGSERGMVVVPGEETSYTIVLAVPGFDRTFLHCAGANDTFSHADVDFELVRRVRLFHFGYPTLMERMFSRNGAELIRMFRTAKETGVTTSLDFSLPDAQSAAGKADWVGILAKVLPNVDLFLPSAEELLFLLDRARFMDLLRTVPPHGTLLDVIDMPVLRELAARCLGVGVKVCVIKCGGHGIYIRTAGADAMRELSDGGRIAAGEGWADRELFQPTFKVRRILTATGAGDNAIAGFLAAFLRGGTVFECAATMALCGAQNLSVVDAVSGVKSWGETQALLERKPPQNRVSLDVSGWRRSQRRCHLGPCDQGGD